MHLEKYSFNVRSEAAHYEFYSKGPKGIVKKVVIFSSMPDSGDNVFNLGFGDWMEEYQNINDLVTTNNKDTEKVLATIAAIIYHFVNLHPGSLIFIKRNTASRTRLYQIGINVFLEEITIDFKIYGFYIDDWEIFVKGKNYQAFLVLPL